MHRASQATALLEPLFSRFEAWRTLRTLRCEDLVTAFAAYALEANCVRPRSRKVTPGPSKSDGMWQIYVA